MTVSDTVVNELIRSWKRARLSTDSESLGFPRINIIAKAVEMGGTVISGGKGARPVEAAADCLTDAERVQIVVDHMEESDRAAFEAYHLGIIRGDSCRGKPHNYRALILGISKKTYKKRVDRAWRTLERQTIELLDKVTRISENPVSL